LGAVAAEAEEAGSGVRRAGAGAAACVWAAVQTGVRLGPPAPTRALGAEALAEDGVPEVWGVETGARAAAEGSEAAAEAAEALAARARRPAA
jgi:hypothetical protein